MNQNLHQLNDFVLCWPTFGQHVTECFRMFPALYTLTTFSTTLRNIAPGQHVGQHVAENVGSVYRALVKPELTVTLLLT